MQKYAQTVEKIREVFFAKHKILTIIIVILIIGTIGNTFGGNKKDQPVSSSNTTQSASSIEKESSKDKQEEQPDLTITASELSKAYDSNEVKADQQYKDKLVLISGKVKSIEVMAGQTFIVLDSGNPSSITDIQCFLNDSEKDKASELQKGNNVSLQGKVDGKSINVSINKGTIK